MICYLPAASGQVQTDVERFERQLELIRRDQRFIANPNIPPEQRSFFDYGMFTTASYLSFDDSELKNHGLRQYDLTAYAHLNVDGVHEFFFRGRGFYRDFNDGDSFDTEVNGADGRIERLYYKFDLSRYLSSTRGEEPPGDISIKVGQDLVFWANGLTISQEIQGGVVDLSYGPATVEIIAGRTPTDAVDFDSSRPNFDDHTNRFFYGAMASTRVGTHRPFVYFLGQRDHNSDDTSTTTIAGTNITTKFDYNSWYIGFGSTGGLTDRLAYGIEAVYQGGDTLSNSFAIDPSGSVTTNPQTRDDIQAWALDGQLDYLMPDTRHTRFSGEVIVATGDSDRLVTSSTFGGNKPDTTDHAFNAFGLLNTGLAFAPAVSNIVILRGGVSTFPFANVRALQRMQVGCDLFCYSKLRGDAPINEPTTDSAFLGFEPDVYMNWQLTSDVTLALRYGAFVPGDGIVNDEKIRQFFYAGVTFAF